MKRSMLVLRSLTHYWRTHLAVLLGVIAGTAVIGGALIVGDSVRGSLRQMSLDRLGGIDHALHSHRFFREELAAELGELDEFKSRFERIVPTLILDGGLVRQSSEGTVTDRAGGVRVFAIDERFSPFGEFTERDIPQNDQIVLSHRAAREIAAKPGDALTLWVELPSTIPRDTLLGGSEEQTTQEIALTVSHVLPETSGTGRLDLNPSQQLPLTVFVSLRRLQSELGLERVRRSKEFPQGKPARVNGLFMQARTETDRVGATALEAAQAATRTLGQHLTLADLGLRITPQTTPRYLSLESEQMILEDAFSAAAKKAASKLQWPKSGVMVYLANELSNIDALKAFSMYSIVAGIEPQEVLRAPFGPLCPQCAEPFALADDEIVLNDWLAEDLKVAEGGIVQLKYHVVGSHGELPEKSVEFQVKGIVSLEESPAATDRGLTPEVRGITDAATFGDWKQPFPMQLNRVTERDETYWDEHKALPKAFISLAAAEKLWKSRYGSLTSLRVAPPPEDDLEESAQRFQAAFLAQLDPSEIGFAVQPVKWNGVTAASGTTDFTGLFIGFSLFVIVSALVLIGLLFRLGIERRVSQIGLLEAVGFEAGTVRRLLLCEGGVVACIGGILGLAAAVGYAKLMILALRSPDWWGGAIGTQFLSLYFTPQSLASGLIISVTTAMLSLLIPLRALRRITPRQLLTGTTQVPLTTQDVLSGGRRQRRTAWICMGVALFLIVAGLAGLIPTSEAFFGLSWQVIAFFIVGIVLLIASLKYFSASLIGEHRALLRGVGVTAIARLGFRNAARHRTRSVLSTALIASATFVIVAVAAGRRNPAQETPDFHSGNGGFSLVGETTTPILPDLNTADGRSKAGLQPNSEHHQLIDDTLVMAFRMKPGEDASCLNLYQTQLPTVLGVPEAMIQRGGFKFIDQRKADYWKLLVEERADGRIPVLGDMNTLLYSLKKGPGQIITTSDSEARQPELAVVGMFDSSVFQGVLLVSEQSFQKLFPEQVGYRYFLIGANDQRLARAGHFTNAEVAQLSELFEGALTPYGFDAERVSDRIAAFLVVQNTYLSTFQTLGGLGLLLGTIGLATVMLRSVIERRAEFALLAAVGFRARSVMMLVLAENALLLILGLASGTTCALLAMMPHLLTVGADTAWGEGAAVLLAVFVTGMLASAIAVREATRTPIVETLRGE